MKTIKPNDTSSQRQKFVVLKHFNYPGKKDHLDILIDGLSDFGNPETPLMKFETKDPLDAVSSAQYQGNIRDRYLTYEGPMSGNRGEVKRVDSGEWHMEDQGIMVLEGNTLKSKIYVMLRRVM